MKPSVPQMLTVLAGELGQQFAPNLPNHFLQSSAQIESLLSLFAAQEAERSAAVRIGDITAMRALFAELADLASPALRTRLEAAAKDAHLDFALSALDRLHADLSGLLVLLHEEVEALDTATGKDACARIWGVLADGAARRQFQLG